MKEYNFTQIAIWSNYVNTNDVNHHMASIAGQGWRIVSMERIPAKYDNLGQTLESGSFNFFWERDLVETEPVLT